MAVLCKVIVWTDQSAVNSTHNACWHNPAPQIDASDWREKQCWTQQHSAVQKGLQGSLRLNPLWGGWSECADLDSKQQPDHKWRVRSSGSVAHIYSQYGLIRLCLHAASYSLIEEWKGQFPEAGLLCWNASPGTWENSEIVKELTTFLSDQLDGTPLWTSPSLSTVWLSRLLWLQDFHLQYSISLPGICAVAVSSYIYSPGRCWW